MLLTADLGWGVLDQFAEQFPDRYLNVGVAEQAMIGVATGMASAGLIPYCYSIASFSVARTFEFLRNGPIGHRLPVRVIGIGPGFEYSHDGFSHYALEDVGLLINQPATRIVAPRDSASAEAFGATDLGFPGLVYIRLSKSSSTARTPALADGEFDATFDPEVEVLVLGFGDCDRTCVRIVEDLRERGIPAMARLVEVLDEDRTAAMLRGIAASELRRIVLVEHHYVKGGFGTHMIDGLESAGWRGRAWKIGIAAYPGDDTGTFEGMMNRHMTNLPPIYDSIADDVRSA